MSHTVLQLLARTCYFTHINRQAEDICNDQIERKVVFEAEEVKRVSMCVCVGVVFSLLISLLCSVIRLVLI